MKSRLYLLLLLLSGCMGVQEHARNPELVYFDLPGFIREYTRDSLPVSVQKIIQVDGKEEKRDLPEYALNRDVREFAVYDINRPALYGLYEADTIDQGNHKEFNYTAKADNLKVRHLKIVLANNLVTQIEIHSITKSFLENMEIKIQWNISNGYLLERKSDKLIGDNTNHGVEVKIIK